MQAHGVRSHASTRSPLTRHTRGVRLQSIHVESAFKAYTRSPLTKHRCGVRLQSIHAKSTCRRSPLTRGDWICRNHLRHYQRLWLRQFKPLGHTNTSPISGSQLKSTDTLPNWVSRRSTVDGFKIHLSNPKLALSRKAYKPHELRSV